MTQFWATQFGRKNIAFLRYINANLQYNFQNAQIDLLCIGGKLIGNIENLNLN